VVTLDIDTPLGDPILRSAIDGEHDPKRAVPFLARGGGVGFPVALLVEKGADPLDRILDQILIDRGFASDRNEFRALLFR
jgi:hypothetical protein